MALVGSKYMDSPDLGKSVLGWFPQHHMVTVIPSSACGGGEEGENSEVVRECWMQPSFYSPLMHPYPTPTLPFTSRIWPSNIWLQM